MSEKSTKITKKNLYSGGLSKYFGGMVEIPAQKSEFYDGFVENIAGLKIFNNQIIVPNLLLTTKIFSPLSPGEDRKFYKKWKFLENYDAFDGEGINFPVEIWGLHNQLDQYDLTVFMYLLKNANRNLESSITRSSILKDMNKERTSESFNAVDSSFHRITTSFFRVVRKFPTEGTKRSKKSISMDLPLVSLSGKKINGRGVQYNIQFSYQIKAFLEMSNWSYVNLDQRSVLSKLQTAQAVHCYLSTNKCPKNGLFFKKQTLKDWWGKPHHTNISDFMKFFRRGVVRPLHDGVNFITGFEEKKDCVILKWKKKSTKNIIV